MRNELKYDNNVETIVTGINYETVAGVQLASSFVGLIQLNNRRLQMLSLKQDTYDYAASSQVGPARIARSLRPKSGAYSCKHVITPCCPTSSGWGVPQPFGGKWNIFSGT